MSKQRKIVMLTSPQRLTRYTRLFSIASRPIVLAALLNPGINGCSTVLGLDDPTDLARGATDGGGGLGSDGAGGLGSDGGGETVDASGSATGGGNVGAGGSQADSGSDSSQPEGSVDGEMEDSGALDGSNPGDGYTILDAEDAADTTGRHVVGQDCEPVGTYACAGHAQKGKLICTGVWTTNGTCDGNYNCDSTQASNVGSCQPIVSQCLGKQPLDTVCSDDSHVVACGPDLVSTVPGQTCSGATPVCLEGACVACSPNAAPSRCANSTPQFCDSTGAWHDRAEGACPTESAPVCQAGNCVAPKVASIVAGGHHTCTRFDNGMVKCWGYNVRGQLGLGDTHNRGDQVDEMGNSLPTVDLGTGRTATAIATGENHTCALLDNGLVKCWGSNVRGQLGLGDTSNRGDQVDEMGNSLPTVDLGTGRTATAIATGNAHTCALLDNGLVKCWGNNEGGQLGLGDTSDRGGASGEMGNNLASIDLGTGHTVAAIAAGAEHTCALLDNGLVKCWGGNSYGQLGLGNTHNRGATSGEMGDVLPTVDLGSSRTALALATNSSHTCALLDNGFIKCWGNNQYGELGLGDTNNRGDASGEMGNALLTIDLGTDSSATAVATGAFDTCALLNNGLVKCWGDNQYGDLGLGIAGSRGDQTGEMGNALLTVDLGTASSATAIATGDYHACALFDNGVVKCWGDNDYGQLGLGDTSLRGDEAGEMGANLPGVVLW